jgi:hypothetical protein
MHSQQNIKIRCNCIIVGLKTDSPDLDYTGIEANQLEAAHTLFETVVSVLGGSIRSKVCRGANFYDLGGNSLNSVFTVTKLREQGYVIGQSDIPSYTAVNMIITVEVLNLHYLPPVGITKFTSAKDLQEVIDQMCCTKESDIAAAVLTQQDKRYEAHMLQDEHKDAVEESVHFI